MSETLDFSARRSAHASRLASRSLTRPSSSELGGQRSRIPPARFLEMVRTRLHGKADEAAQPRASSDSPVASILAAGWRVRAQGRVRMREAMEDHGRRRGRWS